MTVTSGVPGEAPDGAVTTTTMDGTTMDGTTKNVISIATRTTLLKQ